MGRYREKRGLVGGGLGEDSVNTLFLSILSTTPLIILLLNHLMSLLSDFSITASSMDSIVTSLSPLLSRIYGRRQAGMGAKREEEPPS